MKYGRLYELLARYNALPMILLQITDKDKLGERTLAIFSLMAFIILFGEVLEKTYDLEYASIIAIALSIIIGVILLLRRVFKTPKK